jgi:cell volume regulation protein A
MDELRLGMTTRREEELRALTRATADIVVIFVFITLGASLPFDTIADEGLPALATLAALILLARPLTVLLCLLPDRRGRWRREELVFLAWTRETGVVPAALVGVLVAEGVRQESELLTVVALAVVVTLLLQATTKAWLARRLGLEEPEPEERDRRAAHSA